jgi:hypothetical protein
MRFKADTRDLDKLQAQMKAAPRAVRSTYRKGLKEVGDVIAVSAKAKIVDKSPAVARDIKVRTRLPATVIVQGGSKTQPIGKLLEGHHGTPGYWIHPLFGNRKREYPETRQPHLYPAFDEHKKETVKHLKDHVKEGLAAIDLHPDD